MARFIKRDPFARCTLMRYTEEKGECDWCGSIGKLYSYLWEPDSIYDRHIGRLQNNKKFCSIGCYRNYEGQ